ncbi:TRAP transporter large permease subunit [soil metagenome]
MQAIDIAPLMFAGLIIFLLFGYPVAFSLAAVGIGFAFFGISAGYLDASFLNTVPLRLYGVMSNELLLAIPFFTFMGAILERSRLAEDMLEGFGQLFGPVRGGLAYAVIFVGAILGAITGTVAASVIAMAMIALPVMMRYGYNMKLSTGVIAASGTITQLIPPALVLIVLADQLGRSVGDMYKGAIGPSFVQVGLFCLYIFAVSLIFPKMMPALPPEARTLRGWALVLKLIRGMVPSLALIFVVLGTILMGLATPTESGAMGVFGSLALAWFNRRLDRKMFWYAMDTTTRISTMVVFILVGSTMFSSIFQGYYGGVWIEHLLTGLPGGVVGFLIVVNCFIFVLAFFLDFFEIAFIVIPLLAPVAAKLGIDLIWFGVLIGANLQTSFMHPPFGFALFYLRGVAPKSVKTNDIYLGAIPWVGLQLVLVAILIFFPQIVTAFLDAGSGVDPNSINDLGITIDDDAPLDIAPP